MNLHLYAPERGENVLCDQRRLHDLKLCDRLSAMPRKIPITYTLRHYESSVTSPYDSKLQKVSEQFVIRRARVTTTIGGITTRKTYTSTG